MDDQAARSQASSFEDHLGAPRGRGRLTRGAPTGAAGGAACGDLVRVSVRVKGDRVAEAGFDARGCDALTAAGSATVALAEGRRFIDAARLRVEDVCAALGGLVPPKRHAATLAADALHRALGAAAGAGAARIPAERRRTLVAMSGGVDSAVAAQLAVDAGHEVVAVTLELWADPAGDGAASCCSPQAVTGARALAHRMGLPHLTLDLRSRFRAEVVDDFLSEHRDGRTPNPCVRCNGFVRFDALLELGERLGAARLATGHYARTASDGEGPLLRSAADPAKDQTYMLARLAPDRLPRLWFPLGELTKPQVRELARAVGLPVADRPDSQDLCFLAGVGREAFLRRHGRSRSPVAAAPAGAARAGERSGESPRGEIVDERGKVLGHHDGQARFTVGQRRGIGVSAGEPLYVLKKDAATGRVTVGPRAALATRRVEIRNAVLHRPAVAVDRVKLRYRSAPVSCRVEGAGGAGPHGRLTLALGHAVDGVAPGQTACLLRGDQVLGWGTIDGSERTLAAA